MARRLMSAREPTPQPEHSSSEPSRAEPPPPPTTSPSSSPARRTPKRLTAETRRQILLALKAGCSQRDVALELGIARGTVASVVRAERLAREKREKQERRRRREANGAPRAGRLRLMTMEEELEVVGALRAGETYTAVAERHGVSKDTISRVGKRYGLPARPCGRRPACASERAPGPPSVRAPEGAGRRRGSRVGRPRKVTREQENLVLVYLALGGTHQEAAELIGITHGAIPGILARRGVRPDRSAYATKVRTARKSARMRAAQTARRAPVQSGTI